MRATDEAWSLVWRFLGKSWQAKRRMEVAGGGWKAEGNRFESMRKV